MKLEAIIHVLNNQVQYGTHHANEMKLLLEQRSIFSSAGNLNAFTQSSEWSFEINEIHSVIAHSWSSE